jgi:hypothetical protein
MNYPHSTLLWQELAPLLRLASDLQILLAMMSAYAAPLLAVLGFGVLMAVLVDGRPPTTQPADANRPRARQASAARFLPVAVVRRWDDTKLQRARHARGARGRAP